MKIYMNVKLKKQRDWVEFRSNRKYEMKNERNIGKKRCGKEKR